MKSTWFSKRQHYDFAKVLRDTSHEDFHRIFSDFLECAAISLAQPTLKLTDGRIDPDLEKNYLQTINRNPKYPKAFPIAMAALIEGLGEEPHDFLGDTSGALGMNDKNYRGQCFTPYHLCLLMANMTIGNKKPDDFENRQVIFSEPACGGGAMIIATASKLRGNGFFPYNYHFEAQDVDIKCFYMTYIQTTLLNIPTRVIHGNTLSGETWKIWKNLSSVMHPVKRRAEEVTCKAVRKRTRKTSEK